MRYQQTIEVHGRIEEVLRLIGTGDYSTPALAESVGVSIPTISRIVAALREQGHDIRAERHEGSWRYILERTRKRNSESRGIRNVTNLGERSVSLERCGPAARAV